MVTYVAPAVLPRLTVTLHALLPLFVVRRYRFAVTVVTYRDCLHVPYYRSLYVFTRSHTIVHFVRFPHFCLAPPVALRLRTTFRVVTFYRLPRTCVSFYCFVYVPRTFRLRLRCVTRSCLPYLYVYTTPYTFLPLFTLLLPRRCVTLTVTCLVA